MVCLELAVQVSLYGCEVSSSLCLYLQMHTFERIGRLWVLRCNWCWHQHGDMSLQSAAHTEFEGSNVRYRYVCTLWRPWIYIVFYNSTVYDAILSAGSLLTTKAHNWAILSRYNSAHIFITFSLILHCMACCSQIHSIIIIHIFKNLGSDTMCSPQSLQYIFFYWLSSLTFPMLIVIHNSCIVILSFSAFSHFFLAEIVSKFLSSSSVIPSFLLAYYAWPRTSSTKVTRKEKKSVTSARSPRNTSAQLRNR